MKIVMMTNTYKPIVGGLEKSIEFFSNEFRKLGHKVLIVAPGFEGTEKNEKDIFRLPSIPNFNHTDFSIELPISLQLNTALKKFKPDIIHTHHPFLVGDTALRASAKLDIPIIFTNHTLYEENTHYVPGDSEAMKTFVVKLAKGYADLCDQVIAPSESVAKLLKKRGVSVPIEVLPTGIYVDEFKKGDGETFRIFYDIPKDAFAVGIISRLAEEKNVLFLSKAVASFLKKNKNAYFVVVGSGPLLKEIKSIFEKSKLSERLITAGILQSKQLVSAYDALDVFVFASHSETQGMVLAEAMASGTPVVAVDAPGVREIVKDKQNGRIIKKDNIREFAACLDWFFKLSEEEKRVLSNNAQDTAQEYSVELCVDKALKLYKETIKIHRKEKDLENSPWRKAMRMLKTQSEIIANTSGATASAVFGIPQTIVENISKRMKKGLKNLAE
ncbi:MAG: glycosyltransferase [Candidatus Omnitrophica bacterium]|nr:glycosyltransferase [Candidatus Omnitrophota bacterium]MBU1996532.1 glycosyltransferase [Candidatus Omnitrophota bacterium]MBU4333982.1 glycosyltransferase [Candidatus Omnitrophota bacterium]